MKFLFDIGHPADVHYFRNTISYLRERGHELILFARDKDVTLDLLNAYNIDYISKGKGGKGIFDRISYTARSLKLLHESISVNKPDICISHASPYLACIARLHSVPNIMFNDTEGAFLFKSVLKLWRPEVYSPDSYSEVDEKRQKLVPSYMELAYLHPELFTPDESIKKITGKNYILLRFVANNATHDIGQPGISDQIKREIVDKLREHVTVWISSEDKLPKELEKYRIDVPVHKIHDVIAFAKVVIGGSGTMSSEAAMLGVPAIFISDSRLGYLNELSDKYELVFKYRNRTEERIKAIQKAIEIIQTDSSSHFLELRDSMLLDKKNMTQIIIGILKQKARDIGKKI